MGQGPEAWCCWFGFYARHRGAAALISSQEAIEAAGRPPTARVWQGEEVFEQYVRDIITNIYRVLLELLHDVRHRALVYALEPVEVVGLAVACAFFLCGRGDGVRCQSVFKDTARAPAPFCSMRSAQAK